ncbi:tail terminator [Mycobacterium phage Fancypants]|uniref:Tail terminator n=1 Tax=Mycobacterium phage Fancypants TaxID=2530128 RepID=A0A481VUI2_9CAUD|nr:head-tail adaptor [Mycobacterium phage Fancypants]QBI97348.1 tail terminator [Mycobacterium phage Fancypants]
MATDSAPSIHRVLVAWLSPLGKVSTRRLSGDPLPHRVVRRIDGRDVPEEGSDSAVVSVHTFAASDEAAENEAELTHQRMLELVSDPLVEIPVGGGVVARIDYARVLMKPVLVEYDDDGHLVRHVGRYEIGVQYI